ncbi:MAG TPA: hypothetical protein VLD65_05790 [Anaerolineales bacterium]|nr:hypothetical protein [Anaerolineales bacterium]
MSDLLVQAMNAKQIGDIKVAKQLLSQAIVQNPRNESAWMLMAEVVDDPMLRRNCLERVLAINPNNTAANSALNKLNTSPLGPVMHGERNKPLDLPIEQSTENKIPPFTPPFTWDGQPEQYLALGDLTFPEIPEEEDDKLPETPPTFDWTNESSEPDKTIDKIFEAVSKPEMASEPPPQKESNWLDNLRPSDDVLETATLTKKPGEKKHVEQKAEDPWLNELVGSEEASVSEPRSLTMDDFSVSAEPELGLQAFAPTDQAVAAPAEPDSLLWDNPHAKNDRLVILSYRSLIYANPAESDIPHILGLFNEKRMVRDLLGENAHMIKLETIERVNANPKTAKMVIEYKSGDKITSHELAFSSPQVRDEALTALKFRMGAGFVLSTHTITMEDKILTPIVIIVLVAIITLALLGGIPLLSRARGVDSGEPPVFLSSILQFNDQYGIFVIIGAVLICAACGVWMALNLRKPSSDVVLKR